MLFCSCYFRVVLLLSNIVLVINNNLDDASKSSNESSLFSDVIKNISRVNNVLQELIKNYEQLQKMSETQSFETDYSSDSEVDEVFKDASDNKKTKSRTNNDATSEPKYDNFHRTEMIVSEEETEDITEKSNFIEENDNRSPLIQNLQAAETVNTNKIKKEDLKTSGRGKLDHKHSDEMKVPDNVFYDNVHPKKIDRKAKSKRSKLKHKQKENKSDEIYLTTKENVQGAARNVQKVVYTESFNQGKIWDDIAMKKPIKLKAHRSMAQETKRDNRDVQFRTGEKPKKTAIVIVTKNQLSEQESEEVTSDSLTEEEKEIDKELFKTSVLRMAYGDACSKVVVKKCYKALKQVRKSVCRAVKCKTAFKEKLTTYSKAACIQAFAPPNTSTTYYRGAANSTFLDATRGGLEACLPLLNPHTSLRNETLPLNKVDIEVNILRDRYERACERASAAKCNKACKIVYERACENYDCSKRKKKLFKKRCKKDCKMAYKSKRSKSKKDSSESSKSSSDSESDSDDDSLSLSGDE